MVEECSTRPASSDDFPDVEVSFDLNAADAVDDDFVPSKPKAFGFDALEDLANVDEEGNDLGGLMSLIGRAKKGGKKGKKRRDDDEEEDAAAILERLDAEEANGDVPSPAKKGKGKKGKADADEELEDDIPAPVTKSKKGKKKNKGADFDDEMDAIAAEIEGNVKEADDIPQPASKGKKGKKKNKGADFDDEMDALAAEIDGKEVPETPAPEAKGGKGKKGKKNKGGDFDDEMEMLAAEIEGKVEPKEAAPETPKPAAGKAKKGKKGKGGADFDEEMEMLAAQIEGKVPEAKPEPVKETPKPAAAPKDDAEDDPEEGTVRIKSKKEKEKERKERQKLAKKAEAQKQAVKVSEAAPEPAATPEPAAAAADEEDDEGEEEGGEGTGAASKKKKKKKKPAEKKEEPPAKPAGKKKAGIAALQQLLAAQKAAEEEARRKEEEERQRIAEEEARLAELERQKEEAKQRKKEKEKQKKEELKKAGKYMTPAQKQAAQAAQARLQQMLAQGYKIEALNKDGEGESKPKRVVYGNKRKPNKKGSESAAQEPTPTSEEPPAVEEPQEEPAAEPEESVVASPATSAAEVTLTKEEQAEAEARERARIALLAASTITAKKVVDEDDVKDSWDAESDEDVKESWDDDGADQKDEKPKEAVSKAAVTPAKAAVVPNGKAAGKAPAAVEKPGPQTKAKPETKAAPAKAPAQKKKEEEEEEEDDDDEEDEEEADEDEDDDDDEDSEDDDDDEDDDEDDSEDEGLTAAKKQALERKQEAVRRRKERMEQAKAARSKDNLRSPICCILGHVDTGKTKLLDKIRQTNVQEGEAGGITQQIGATYFPIDAIEAKTAVLHKDRTQEALKYNIPGLLIIDTPGHESFTNLRSRGSSLCNIAILVVDLMHGLEQQTIESIGLLRQRKTPFVVALNKIDRIYGWQAIPNNAFQDSLKQQPPHVIKEFEDRVERTILAFAEQGLNAKLYYENPNYAKYVSLIPTSAITGEGVPDLLDLIINLTQTRMTEDLMYLSELECTVLEVKVIEGLGTTIDVILSNGVLNEGDRIVLCGLNGPIITNIRALLTPEPMREIRVKSAYVHHKQVKAAQGIKIAAPDLEKAIAGSRLMVIKDGDDEDDIIEEIISDFKSLNDQFVTPGKGVCVQASTLGSLEALLVFLKSSKIPVSGYNIGPIHKKDISRASIMLERAREFAMILAFDVPIDKEAADMAEELGIKIFKADIIYHLFDKFTAHMKALEEQRRKDQAPQAVFPCILKIIPGMVFNKRSPIIMGVDVVEGILKVGTPLCVVNEDRQVVELGRCTGIQLNRKERQEIKKGEPSVSIKVEVPGYETPKMFGRHFTIENDIYSRVTRASIDILKTTFRNDLTMDDWVTVKKLKSKLGVE
ncbi:hypothetical protein HDU96_002925 [Phlyctochytrium bullatum]|nr:hypothetical protein HDU96_002925 [Phlyctochytrium bullatum]